MHISRLANWLVDVQIGKQANNQASKQHSQPVLNSTLHILHIVARVQHTHRLHAIYVCCLHTHIHTDTSIRLYCLGEQQTQYCCCYCSTVVAVFSFSFFSCVILWHIMACDFGMAELCLYVHDNRFSTMSRSQWFCFCFLFFDVRPNILQENQITLHMQSQNVCCFPGRWVDVSIYWNIICCFLLFVYLQIECYKWNIRWIETLQLYTLCIRSLRIYVFDSARVWAYFFPSPACSLFSFNKRSVSNKI